MTKKLYSLTPEHKEQLRPWADKWIANAMSTKPMDDGEKEVCRNAVEGLYKAAGLTPPPRERIVFVSSPAIGRFSAGFAAAIWHTRKTGFRAVAATSAATDNATDAATSAAAYAATSAATDAATRAATDAATSAAAYAATSAATDAATRAATDAATSAAAYDATRAATDAATSAATDAATSAATYDATRAATSAATDNATSAATYDATRAATDAATFDATYAATFDAINNPAGPRKWFRFPLPQMVKLSVEFNLGKFGLMCAERAWDLYQGGNQWSGWASYISFFRHIVKLDIDYSKWDHYEKLAEHSGWRFMHKEFCIVCDRPEVLLVDDQNRPHCETGPFCKYRDGFALYSIHGTRVPAELVETPADKLDVKEWLAEENVDWRRIAFEKIGLDRVTKELGAVVVDHYTCPVGGPYDLLEIDVGIPEKKKVLSMMNPSLKQKTLEGVPASIKTVKEAICFRDGLKEYHAPAALS